MEAFNIPYCGIDLNQAIGTLEFIKSNPFGLAYNNSTSITISGNICVIHAIVFNGYEYGEYSFTSLKDESFSTTIRTVNNGAMLIINKSGTSIQLTAKDVYGANGVIYEFNFA